MPEHKPELCPNCGSPLGPQDEECWKCGQKVDHDQAQEAVPHAEAPAGGDSARRPKLLERLRGFFRRA